MARQHGFARKKAGLLLPALDVYHCATKEIRATTLTVAELPLAILHLARASTVCPCGLQAPTSLRRVFAEDNVRYACAISDAHMGPICKSRPRLDCGFRTVLLVSSTSLHVSPYRAQPGCHFWELVECRRLSLASIKCRTTAVQSRAGPGNFASHWSRRGVRERRY
jgi:hypothetical protein